MDQVVWIEVLSRHRDVVARHRCAAGVIKIGRAYDNDIVIDDPFVAPHHLRISRDDAGHPVVEDCGSVNGLFLERGAGRHDRVVVDGGVTLRIGHTRLRVLTADHPVAPERPAGGDVANWTTLGALAVAPLGAVALSIWLSETIEPKPSRYLLPLVGLAGVVLLWTAAWAVLSRVFASSAHFERNLRIALLGIAGYWLFHNAMTAAAFGFAWRIIGCSTTR
jgi:hypothetical protein